MLLLVTIVLVLIAAVTLLIGIFGDSLALIFVSIGASVLAALVLGVVSQMSKRRPAEATAGGPAPLGPPPVEEPATARIGAVGSAAETLAPSGPPPVSAVGDAASGVGGALPIAGYDTLRVNEIVAKLDGLDLDELEAVAQHEESTKNRTSVLNKIDELMDALEAAEVDGAAAPVGAATGAAAGAGAALGAPSGFPIADYDELDVEEIVDVLADLDMDELETVAEYEETHANRDAVLDAIDDRLDELEGLAPAGVATTTSVKKAAKKAVKKSSAKKATVKKAATRAASTTKKAATRAPAKKAASTRTATTRTATKKAAPARKAATAKKATAKKSTAKKAAAKKTAKKATRR